MNTGSGIKKGISWLTATGVIYECVRFGGVAILARLLEPADFGIMGIALMVTGFTDRLSGFGFLPALIQRKEINDNHISTVFSVSIIIRLIACLILVGASSYIGAFFNSKPSAKVIAVLSLSVLIQAFVDVPMTLLKRDLYFRKYALLVLAIGVFALLCSIGFAFMGLGVWSLVYGNLFGSVLNIIVLFALRVRVPKFKYSHAAIKDLFSFSGWMFFENQLSYIADNVDYFVVGKVLGATSLGFYERAFSLMMLPYRRIAKNVNAVLFPAFSRSQEDLQAMRLIFRKTILSISLVSYPIMVGLILVAPEFIHILLGPKWTPTIIPFQILCIAGIFNFLTGSIISVMKAQGLAKELVWGEGISAVVLVVGVIIGSFKGITGVSVAVVFYNILEILLITFLFISHTRIINWSDFLNPQMPPFIGALGMAIGVSILRQLMAQFISSHPVLILLSSVIPGVLIYTAILFMLKTNEISMLKRELLNDMKSIIKRKLIAKKATLE